jgi:hypothetical protein
MEKIEDWKGEEGESFEHLSKINETLETPFGPSKIELSEVDAEKNFVKSIAQIDGWDEEKAKAMSEWFKNNPTKPLLPHKDDINTQDNYSLPGLDPWMERVQATNRALAKQWGVEVNELGVSVGPAVAQITQKNRQVSLEMGPMIQLGYDEYMSKRDARLMDETKTYIHVEDLSVKDAKRLSASALEDKIISKEEADKTVEIAKKRETLNQLLINMNEEDLNEALKKISKDVDKP